MKVQSRKIGVEFEFDSSWSNLKKSASKHIKSIYGKNQYYSHPDSFKSDFKTDKWHIKEDTSGLSELTTPISKKKDIKNIVKVIKRIHKDGITVSKDCGIHVHVDIHDFDLYHFVACWIGHERTILGCFSKDRRECGSCNRLIVSSNTNRKRIVDVVEDITDAIRNSRESIGWDKDTKTIEIRICEATDDIFWIETWLHWVLHFIDYFHTYNPTLIGKEHCNFGNLPLMLDHHGLKNKYQEKIEERYSLYQSSYWR
jgi:hypothetical protein